MDATGLITYQHKPVGEYGGAERLALFLMGVEGRPQKFSDLAIETVLTLRLVFHLQHGLGHPWRCLKQGFGSNLCLNKCLCTNAAHF